MKDLAKTFLNRYSSRTTFFRSLRQPARVLDLGCGSGRNGIALREIQPTAELFGIDITAQPDLPRFYSFSIVDVEKEALPFPEGYFDAIIFAHVIEHLRSPLKLGAEINRVMNRGARIYVETPNWTTVFAPSFGFHREQHNPFNFYDDPTHVKPWTRHGLFDFLSQSCGLRVLKVGSTRNWLRIPLDPLIMLGGFLKGNRSHVVSSFWNLYGWCIFGVGIKE